MKRSILILALLTSLAALTPALQARDRDYDSRDSYDDMRADVHKLWDWYGHLKDEARDRGSRHVRERLDGIQDALRRVEGEMHYGGRRDRIRDEIADIRDSLRKTSDELHSGGSHHGFSIQIR
jgi:hypothetical protein